MKRYLIPTILVLSACSMTLPVNGQMGQARFLGEATGYITGDGKLSITTEDSDTCQGEFEYTSTGKSGTGSFNCQSGKAGNFQFTSNGTAGRGFGKTTDGEKFNFTFGHPTARVEEF